MKMICCGVVYDTDDPQTYWCIQKYIFTRLSKKSVNGLRVAKEIVYVLVCSKNGCTKLELHRYGSSDESRLLEKECYSGRKAIRFLKDTSDTRKAVPQICPIKVVSHSKRIPFVYGKAIDAYTQRGRYMSEDGWDAREAFYSPVKIFKLENTNKYKNSITNHLCI